jgi:tetratricopeptide (TPR) repeat protein
MIKRIAVLFLLLSITYKASSQKQKINAAWRALTDYQSTLKEKPDPSYLNKAKESIDAAAANEESKTNPKMHVYRAQIYYELFKYNLKTMEDALAATVPDKNQRKENAYSNVSTVEFSEATKSMEFIQKNVKDQSILQEVTLLGLSMLSDLNNLAVGRYKAKKYDEASGFFESEYSMNAMINGGKKDTATLFNAGLCAQRAKNYEKMAKINQQMVNDKLANASTYQSLYTAKINLQDSSGALASLQEGRALYPNDMSLLTTETDYFLQTGKQEQSLANLAKTLEKDPNNALLHFITGNIYDGMANPKTPDGKDKDKPVNFSDLFAKAEEHYKKAVDLKPSNQDYYFNALYNLGALYNNYGVYLYNKAMSDASIAKLVQKQKEITEKSNELYRKAIPYFEQALTVKNNDVTTMQALRKLYLLTGNEAKANEMTVKLKNGK